MNTKIVMKIENSTRCVKLKTEETKKTAKPGEIFFSGEKLIFTL